MNTSSKSKIKSLFLNRKPQHKTKNAYGGRKGPTQKKIEPWALGGVYGQHQLLKPDVTVTIDPLAMNSLPKTTVLLDGAVAGTAKPSAEIVNADDNKKINNDVVGGGDGDQDKSKSDGEQSKPIDDADNKQKSDEVEGECKANDEKDANYLENKAKSDGQINNMATLSIDEVKRKRNRNEDSIDSITKFIDDDDSGKTTDVLSKLPDIPKSNGNANGFTNNGKDSRKHRKSRKRRNKNKLSKQTTSDSDYESEEDKEERIVKCLYYSLKCCECSIS